MVGAKEILGRMTGTPVPAGWQGGLPFTYRLTGPADLTVRVRVEQPRTLTRVANVVGTIEGREFPDEWVIFGSHHDAWGHGATDPNSGTAMLLTLADALGSLDGDCRPRRTIKIAHWDAEEFFIMGSAEWVEEHRDELRAKAVAYINADSAVTGPNFGGSSAPSLKRLMVDAARAVTHPDTGAPVYAQWEARLPAGTEPDFGNLGGGSDHVPFYSHIGIPRPAPACRARRPSTTRTTTRSRGSSASAIRSSRMVRRWRASTASWRCGSRATTSSRSTSRGTRRTSSGTSAISSA
jgi:N-acetylated-alpha-linked acidic dipeptidase